MNLIQSERQRGLQGLVATGDVKMNWSPDVMERRAPFGIQPVAEDRIRGMLLGLAIGDSLGNTTEGQLPSNRRERYGEVRDYLPNGALTRIPATLLPPCGQKIETAGKTSSYPIPA
jgi:hypothetical protein